MVRLDVVDGAVVSARTVLGAVLGSAQRLPGVDRAITGLPVGPMVAGRATAAFEDELVDTVDDVHASAAYRREMAKVQLRRALSDTAEGNAQ